MKIKEDEYKVEKFSLWILSIMHFKLHISTKKFIILIAELQSQ